MAYATLLADLMERLIRYFYREVDELALIYEKRSRQVLRLVQARYGFNVYGTVTYRSDGRNFLNISTTNIFVQQNN